MNRKDFIKRIVTLIPAISVSGSLLKEFSIDPLIKQVVISNDVLITDRLRAYRELLSEQMKTAQWVNTPVWADMLGFIGEKKYNNL